MRDVEEGGHLDALRLRRHEHKGARVDGLGPLGDGELGDLQARVLVSLGVDEAEVAECAPPRRAELAGRQLRKHILNASTTFEPPARTPLRFLSQYIQ